MGCCSRKWEFILEEKSDDGKILPHSSSSLSSSSDGKEDGFGAAAPEKAKVVVPLAYRTPTRRFRGLLCVGRSEENEERGDAKAEAEAASRRRGKRRRKRRTTAASTSSSTSSVVFSAERGDDDESDDGENDETYHYQNRRESMNLAAVVEKYKTFLESKNMRIPRWLFQ